MRLEKIIKEAKIDGHAFHHPIVMLHIDTGVKELANAIRKEIREAGERLKINDKDRTCGSEIDKIFNAGIDALIKEVCDE